ncbi:hypothetical protein TWF102_005637 [Orbilia oligospora]|uniref:Uncharacterized protein n=1 Tax=Orbilia oligospora TaxID=2813651 RepID=A0A7C8JA04_ORBOL|nr:hypothetical protein TWF103_011661 [Orbilia oligospora]KAF3099234.1 hypothetical protein TWF102_005637 [Orbilia oligospora]
MALTEPFYLDDDAGGYVRNRRKAQRVILFQACLNSTWYLPLRNQWAMDGQETNRAQMHSLATIFVLPLFGAESNQMEHCTRGLPSMLRSNFSFHPFSPLSIVSR